MGSDVVAQWYVYRRYVEGESSDISVGVSPVSASLVQFDRVSSE